MQLNWFRGDIWLPLLAVDGGGGGRLDIVGVIILRRRGVYFSLLTLALAGSPIRSRSAGATSPRRRRPRWLETGSIGRSISTMR